MEDVYGKTPKSLIFDGKLLDAFCMLSGAKMNDGVAWMGGDSVQVINPRDEWVKVEFMAGKGKDGWCSRSAADKTALLFPRGFVLVDTVELMRYAQKKVLENGDGRVTRADRINGEMAHHRMWGKPKQTDVYTVIHKKELLELEYEFYQIR